MKIDKDVLKFIKTLPEERKQVIRKMIKLFGCKKLEFVKEK